MFQLGLVAAELFTGKNPLRHGGPAAPVELNPLGEITGALRESIRARLDEMLVPDTETRLPASRLLARWLDLFRVQAKRQNIHRHAASLQQGTFAKAPEEQPEKQAIPDDTPPKERSEEEAINEIQPPPTSTNPVDPSE